MVRMQHGLADPASALRLQIAAVDRSIAVSRVVTLESAINRSIWQERFFATILAGFGGLALLLALIGLYGVLAYSISQRTHEMGIRMALGASAHQIRMMVLLQSGRLIAGGLVLGVAGAVVLARFLTTQLYGIRPDDLRNITVVAAFLAAAALLATYLPARKATAVDPTVALREQ